MSRGRKLLVAGLAVFALTISTIGERSVRAQESSGPTLSQRFTALGNAFKRGKPQSKPAGQRPTTVRPNQASTTRPNASGNKRTQSTSRGITDFLPSGLFGRNKSNAENSQQQIEALHGSPGLPSFLVESEPEAPAAQQSREKQSEATDQAEARSKAEAKVEPQSIAAAHAESTVTKTLARTIARKSPATTRQENLEETLSDLLQNEAVISDHETETTDQVVADKSEPVAMPPVEEAVEQSEDSTDQVAEKSEPAEEEVVAEVLTENAKPQADDAAAPDQEVANVEEKKTETVAQASTQAKPNKKQKNSLDVSAAIESVAAETAATEAEVRKSKAAGSIAAKKPVGKVDVHDTLLSGELYDELVEAEAEASEEQIAESESEELDEPLARTAAAPRPARALPDHQAEERVAEVTALPFESMGERPAAPQPSFQSPDREVIAQPEPYGDEPEVVAGRNRIRSDAMPISSLRKPAGEVLVTSEQPVIVSHVEGPRSILVGREATYRVVLENTSNIDAQNLSAAIQVPEWADLVDVVSTSGEVARHGADTDASALEWRLPELAARSSQTLRLRMIPRSGREFQLGVQWTQESASAEALVQVQEPKLEMSIQGPQEVLFGAPQRFRLTIFNPGTGPAERVAVCLIPPGKDSASAATHAIGTVGPDEVKEIEMELTAREAGELILQASATAAGGLQAEAIKRVLCHKPELEVDWRGPHEKFAGTETAYYFRVSNPGTAPTDPLEVKLRLPEGIRFLSASDSYAVDSATGVVTWRLSGLAPGEEQFMQIRCQLDSPGAKEFDVSACTVTGELRDSKSIHTNVVALADLKLNITDPQGARPVGETVVYEIRVENRGTTDAHGVSIVGLFSDGIDPVSVEGAQNSVRDGRVTFQPVKSLPAGGEVLLRIRAVASQVGTHIFRAEVGCQDLDIKLAAEETTRFFQDEFHWEEGETPYTAERSHDTISR